MTMETLIDERQEGLHAWLAGGTVGVLLLVAAFALIGFDVPATGLLAAPSSYYAVVAGGAGMVAVLLGIELLRTGRPEAAAATLAFLALAAVTAGQHWSAVLLPVDEARWPTFLAVELGAQLAKTVLFALLLLIGVVLGRLERPIVKGWRTVTLLGLLPAALAAAWAAMQVIEAAGLVAPGLTGGMVAASTAGSVMWIAGALALAAVLAAPILGAALSRWLAVVVLGQLLAAAVGFRLTASQSLGWYGAVACAAVPVVALVGVLLHALVARHDRALGAFARLEQLARVDGLTGLSNRRYLDTRLEREWRRARREGRPLGLMMIDIDGFRAFNERYGHVGGDDCLRRVAACVDRMVERPGDVCGRYGGDELAVILPATDLEGVRKLAGRICNAVRRLGIPTSPVSGVVTVSIGIAALEPVDGVPLTALIESADRALYRAKSSGRDRVAEDLPVIPALKTAG